MRRIAYLLAGTTLAIASPTFAALQDAPQAPQGSEPAGPADALAADEGGENIVVTARKREESLQDVPVSVSAISGQTLQDQNIRTVAEATRLVPGLNVASDSPARAFVSIRGIGTTLQVQTQPGVGFFIDGVYLPSTAYLLMPLPDIERLEVLRGPQGTLYGKNTLGGAINVILRAPGNELRVNVLGQYTEGDDGYRIGGGVSGPIVADRIMGRVSAYTSRANGFYDNVLLGTDADVNDVDSVEGALRFMLGGGSEVNFGGYYIDFTAGSQQYSQVASETDTRSNINLNERNLINQKLRGVNIRALVAVPSINTDITLIGSANLRQTAILGTDLDFTPIPFLRANSIADEDVYTAELRFDTDLSDELRLLVGLFVNEERTDGDSTQTVVPLARNIVTFQRSDADTFAAFGTLTWNATEALELSAGLRYDHETRTGSSTQQINGIQIGGVTTTKQTFEEVEPKLTVSYDWTEDLMTYASVARGTRAGGLNSAAVPPQFREFDGDAVWAYEAGVRATTFDNRLQLSGAVYYNDYTNYIGPNALIPLPAGGFAAVVVNTGDVESYGFELEAIGRVSRAINIHAGLSYNHARVTDQSGYVDATGMMLNTDRILLNPDWTWFVNPTASIPLGGDTRLRLSATASYKGDRVGASANSEPILEGYILVDALAAIEWRNLELALFANNLFDEAYFDTFIEGSVLVQAGLPNQDIGILGGAQNFGVRLSYRY